MENINQGKNSSVSTEKKAWNMPELIVIDKKVIESGYKMNTTNETSTYRGTT